MVAPKRNDVIFDYTIGCLDNSGVRIKGVYCTPNFSELNYISCIYEL